jgi:hypothetical protein
MIRTASMCLGAALLAMATPTLAIDSDLYQRYQSYKARQQVGQASELSEARVAAQAGNFAQAEQHLAAARNMAYAPTEVAAVEQLIA